MSRIGVADLALADVVAGADLGVVGDGGDGPARAPGFAGLAEQQFARRHGQRLAALGQHRQHAVFRGVADEDAAEQPGAVGVEDQLLVRSLERVFVGDGLGRSFSSAKQSPKLATSTPMSLSLVDMSAPLKRGSRRSGWRRRSPPSRSRAPPGRRSCRRRGRLRRWRKCPGRRCAGCRPRRRRRAGRPQAAAAGQLVARLDAGGDDDHLARPVRRRRRRPCPRPCRCRAPPWCSC